MIHHLLALLEAPLSGAAPAFRYLSLCSGIEAASEAWHPLGGHPIAFSEIEPFPCAVLKHRWPGVPNLGDMTRWREWPEELLAQVDVLVGGTPCQAFSVAGLRNSLADARGNLTLVYAQLLNHIDEIRRRRGLPPVICVWENVPGVLNTKDNAFGCFLGALAGEDDALVPAGPKWTNAGCVFGPSRAICWRVLDAQYFGVAQRRRRVFLVGSARDGFRPEEVLFESEGVRRDSAPRREARESPTYELAPCLAASGRGFERTGDTRGQDCLVPSWWDGGQVSQTLDAVLAKGQMMPEKNRFPCVLTPDTAHTLRAEGFDASEDGTGRGTPLVPVHTTGAGFWQEGFGTLRAREQDSHENLVAFSAADYKEGTFEECDQARPLTTSPDRSRAAPIVAFSCKDHGGDASEIAPTLRSMGHDGSHANGGGQVAVAFQTKGSNLHVGDISGTLGTNADRASGSAPMVAINTLQTNTNPLASSNGSAAKTNTSETLRTLRSQIGEEAFTQWGFGILDSLQPSEVLRSVLHGCGIRYKAPSRSWLVCGASTCEKTRSEGALWTLRETGCLGRSSSGWQPPEQLVRELGAYLSLVSQSDSPTERFLQDLWGADERSGLLRKTLSAFQKVGRPLDGESESACSTFAVRRLTVKECCRLQGFPDDHTLIPWKGKPASDCPDGPQYKALGNSMAVPCMRWIGKRLLANLV